MKKIISLFAIVLISLNTIAQCPDENHPHAIDLGLPSGTKWACCNVGAESPEGYGSYYAWGEIEEKDDYGYYNYIYYDSSIWKGPDLGHNICGTEFDVAYVKWGNSWQMFSKEQCQELFDNCFYEITYINEVKGVKFTSSNGNYIFFPAAGEYSSEVYDRGEFCYYWSGTREMDESFGPYGAIQFHYYDNEISYGLGTRVYGCSIRPVKNETESINRINYNTFNSSNLFNINGIKIPKTAVNSSSLNEGIYVLNGKKVLIKK